MQHRPGHLSLSRPYTTAERLEARRDLTARLMFTNKNTTWRHAVVLGPGKAGCLDKAIPLMACSEVSPHLVI